MASLFDALSETYDAVGVDFFQPIASGLVAQMAPQRGESWLDIGCGRGAVLLPVADLIGASGSAVGLDISPGMVKQTRRLAEEAGLLNVACIVDDAQAPSLVDGPFDAISACLVLFFLADPVAALRNWMTLLRPEGRLGVTTFGPVDPRWQYVDEVFAPYLPPAMKDARTTGKVGPFESDEGMEALLSQAGISQVHTVTASIPVRFESAWQWHAFTWSVGQRAMWLAVPEDVRGDVRNEAELRLAEFAEPDGSISFTQNIRHTLGIRPV